MYKVESCSDCKKKFSDNQPFYKEKSNDYPYCVECYHKLNSKTCNGCNKTIENNEKMLTLTFHGDCLNSYKCSKCSKV